MTRTAKAICVATFSVAVGFCSASEARQPATIPAGSKVYIAPMDGFETYMKTALETKKVPLVVVDNKQDAEFEITGTASTQKAGTAKKLITGSWHSREEASIQVTDLKAGTVVFAYSCNTPNSTHGKRSSAEACAKHLKEAVKSQ